jgi:phosphatidylglycerophosphate synthase
MSEGRPGGDAPRWDGPITVALLLAGLISVTQVVAVARDLPGSLDAAYAAAGRAALTHSTLATAIGYAICAVQMLALIGAIAVSVPRLRARRLSFWVPLLAGFVCTAVTVALLFVAVATDPASFPAPTSTATAGA